MVKEEEEEEKGTRVGKYELGRTLGEGNFAKVKHAKHVETGKSFAVKIFDRKRILQLKFDDQIKREIRTLKLLRHPNVVRLHEVLASKTKIYIILEFVHGGELFHRIEQKGRLPESKARLLFQQLIDAVCYCHELGVYHRDLKLENILIDRKGNIKISDFGLSALPQDVEKDGLLHTTCGTPNYIAPEVLANRGYDGSMSDIWSCGVILYVMLAGYLPFEDRNIAVLYQKIFKGETKIPKSISPDAHNLIRKILDPNPRTRIDIAGIRADDWFSHKYSPIAPDDNEDISIDNKPLLIKEANDDRQKLPTLNAFELIGMSSYLDLSGFFEKEDISERRIRFTSSYSPSDLFERIEVIVTKLEFQVQKGYGKLKLVQLNNCSTSPNCQRSSGSLLVIVEVFKLSPSLYVVELRKSYGDSSVYKELCRKISEDLGAYKQLSETPLMMSQQTELKGEMAVAIL